MAIEFITIKDADGVDRQVAADAIPGSGFAQVFKTAFGADGAGATLVSSTDPLPTSAPDVVEAINTLAEALGNPGGGSMTPEQILAALSGAITDAQVASGAGIAQSKVAGLSTSLAGKQDTVAKGQANGYASLGSDGKVPSGQLPASSGGSGLPSNVVNRTSSYTAAAGDLVLCNATGGTLTITLPTGTAVGSLVTVIKTDNTTNAVNVAGTINGDADGASFTVQDYGAILEHAGSSAWRIVAVANETTGTVVTDAGNPLATFELNSLTAADVGLGNVNNTSDANKPVSTATQTALNLKADLTDARFTSAALNTQTGDYTLVLSDAGKVVEVNSASAQTVTVPPNASVAFPVGTIIEVRQYGAGAVSLAPGSSVTLNSPDGNLDIARRFSSASLHKRATNEWVVTGDLA